MSASESSWSYSHMLYQVCAPFAAEVDNVGNFLMTVTPCELAELIGRILAHYRTELAHHKVHENKIFVHCIDVNYSFPPEYDFKEKTTKFIESGAVILFRHLDNFEIVKRLLALSPDAGKAQHPVTGDTLWHLNPFFIDLLEADLENVYNFRGETPEERQLMAELFDFTVMRSLPDDVDNAWLPDTVVFAEKKCKRDPLALCKYIKKSR